MTETREIKLTIQVYETVPSKDSLDIEFVEFLPTKYLTTENISVIVIKSNIDSKELSK